MLDDIIKSAHATIRPLKKADFDYFKSVGGYKLLVPAFNVLPRHIKKAGYAFEEGIQAFYNEEDGCTFKIIENAQGEKVGFFILSVFPYTPYDTCWLLHYYMAPTFRAFGYDVEVVKALMAYLEKEGMYDHVMLSIRKKEREEIEFASRCGFRFETTRYIQRDGIYPKKIGYLALKVDRDFYYNSKT